MANGRQRNTSETTGGDPGAIVELRPSAAVARRIEEMSGDLGAVISSAERAAERITREARERAELQLAEAGRAADRLAAERARMVAALTDELAEQAGSVRRRSDDLMAALERQTREVEQAYATMIESLAGVSARLADRVGTDPAALEQVTLSQRREVSFRVPLRADSSPVEVRAVPPEPER